MNPYYFEIDGESSLTIVQKMINMADFLPHPSAEALIPPVYCTLSNELKTFNISQPFKPTKQILQLY